MPTALERLTTAIASRYEILREVGRGGMATVYLAKDLKHNREVAVKVLTSDVAFALGPERFRREIELASHLSHPHILPIYDSGDADGELYYVMPYVTGESLRARLNRERQLPVDESLRIASEVASALDHSHRHGIIHRDIKPENILLEDGQAMVADFGIARAISAVGGERLTQSGISLGTPTYMSPEQGMADPNLDGRTDIYSLGCVLYEMLAGQPPFTGRTTQALIARHTLDEVPSLTIVRNTITDEVEDVVLCSLEKVPADRFATAGEFASALKGVQETGSYTRGRTGRRTRSNKKPAANKWRVAGLAVGIGLVALGAAAWAGRGLLGNTRNRAASTASAGGFRPQRIAVLYFRDASTDKSLGYLADGLSESLIQQLGSVGGLDVISKGGVRDFRGLDIPRDSIARALEAGTLVDGSVEPDGKRVRVNLRLLDGNSGVAFAEAPVVAALGDPFALRNKLAEQLAVMLREWLRDAIRLRELRTGTQSPAAWSLVQRGEKLRKDADVLDKNGDPAGASRELQKADTLFAQAESLDGRWTEPIVLQGVVAARQERLTKDSAEARKWIDAGIARADRAIALDQRDANALELRGSLRIRPISRGFVPEQAKRDELIRSAEKDLRAAIALNPTQAGALERLSAIQYQRQDAEESHNLAERAYAADAYLTAAPEILWRLYATSYDLEQFDNAQKWCQEAERRFPRHLVTARCALWIMTAKGAKADPAAARRRALDYANVAPPQMREYYRREGEIVVAAVLGRAGLPDSARHVLARARVASADKQIDPRGELMGLEAFVRTSLGDKKEAVDLLVQYLTDHPEHRAGFVKANAWWWRNLRSDPRFKTLIAVPGT